MEKALTSMQPEVVAHLLSEVEKRWEESRVASLRKQMDEGTALEEMTKSCSKVSKAIIEGSDGDKDKVVEYMHDVCSSLSDETKSCDGFAASIEGFMTNDAEQNRDRLDLPKFCQQYWSSDVTKAASVEVKRLDAEDAERAKEAAEKKKREEEAAKAKEAEEAKKAEESAEAQEAQDLEEAKKLEKNTSDDEIKVSADVKEIQAQMQLQESYVEKTVDDARKALQVAAEKEAQAAEAKVEDATPADEVAAKKAGDAQASLIAQKALMKGTNSTKSTNKTKKVNSTLIAEKAIADAMKAIGKAQAHIANDKELTVADTVAAVAAGDKLADKIAAKAVKNAPKTNNTAVAVKNATQTNKTATAKKVVAKKA